MAAASSPDEFSHIFTLASLKRLAYLVISITVTWYFLKRIVKPAFKFFSVWIATSRFPGPPKTNWLSGHASTMTLDEEDLSRRRTFWKYGKAINWQIGTSNFVTATHPDTAKVILQRAGDGLLTSSGEKWHRNRKLITPAFHFSVLRSYIPIFQNSFEKLSNQWLLESKDGQSVDVFIGMKFTTLESLLNCAFGEYGMTDTTRCVWQYFDFIYNLSANGRAFAASLGIVNGYCMRVINQSRKAQSQSSSVDTGSHSPTFTQILLQAKDEDGKGMTTKEILDEVNTFVFAGHDTTGSAIPYCLYYLAKYPEWQEKCRKEICDVMGDKNDITWECISSLKSVTLFIKECLRMAGPVLAVSRTTTDDIPLKNERTIPKGCQVGTYMESVHYNPSVWQSPEIFDPLRFSAENANKRHPYAFLAFSAGPRHCIGQSFAMAEIKVAIIVTIRKFKLSLDDTKPLKMSLKHVIRGTEDGMWLKMERI